jgi:catechol 2,3-dioxygenase-like lactoylglutathione lyase family enzyme
MILPGRYDRSRDLLHTARELKDMPAEQLDHYTIECADLERTRSFYCDVLGLADGVRPAIGIPGHWLYCGGAPVVHLMKRKAGEISADHSGRLDHIAFRCTEPEAMRARLRARDIPFQENAIPGFGLLQMFVRDPDGLQLELNFRAMAG